MKSSLLIWMKTTILLTNILEIFFVMLFFFGSATTFSNDFYRYVEVFQFCIGTLGAIIVIAPHVQTITQPGFIDKQCYVVSFLAHTGFHIVGYIVVLNTMDIFAHGAIMFMIGISINSINTIITYLSKE